MIMILKKRNFGDSDMVIPLKKPRSGSEPLLEILKLAKRGKLALPQFQRDFVWSRKDIKELLISLLRGYYIGTFLFLEIDPNDPPFKARPIQGVEISLERFSPKLLILDGQQRITSLYYALYAPKPELVTPKYTKKRYYFFLDLKKLEEDNVEDAIFSMSEDDKRAKKYLEKENQFENKIIPFTVLKK